MGNLECGMRKEKTWGTGDSVKAGCQVSVQPPTKTAGLMVEETL
jgi:hypothetical protein